MLDGTHYFECSCGSPEHTIRFTLDKGDPPLVYCDFYLSAYLPWYKRLIVSVKYVFKQAPQNEHFANWILRREDVERLLGICEELIEFKNKP